MPHAVPLDPAQVQALLIAVGIGLLIGLEREHVRSARAGLRTFGLVGLFGALNALLGRNRSVPYAAATGKDGSVRPRRAA